MSEEDKPKKRPSVVAQPQGKAKGTRPIEKFEKPTLRKKIKKE